MGIDNEDLILRLALGKGLLSDRDLKDLDSALSLPDATDPSAARWGPKIATLIRRGRIAEEAVSRLAREVGTLSREVGNPAGRPVRGGADMSYDSKPVTPFPSLVPGVRRYELVELLGQGGMGEVYRARDLQLDRPVALKLLRGEPPRLAQRFVQEARAQAQITHPHVCKVHDVGEYQGRPYIAMQLIEGKTLKELAPELKLEVKVRIMEEVAMAIHAAHRAGLVHRDLKPSNIMLEKTQENEWWPYVLDFGIARATEAPHVTMTGAVLGTPNYMSPEQAAGNVCGVDHRSDIYGLGATLYDLLTGQPPHAAATPLEVMIRKIEDDAPRPRVLNPAIPRDIETIVLKCLERERERRYASAAAFAEDLRRFLDGEPILAARPSWSYRFMKRLQKNKLLAGVFLTALLATTILAALIYETKRKAEIQSALSYQYGQRVKEMEGIIHTAYLLPLHDVSRAEQVVREQLKWIEQEMERAGDLAAVPGHYALGRGHLVLHEYEEAEKHLEIAWHGGFNAPEVAYSLGHAKGALYVSRLMELDRYLTAEAKEAARKKIEREYRTPALNYLRAATQCKTETVEYLAALIAFYENHWDLALKRALEAEKSSLYPFEAQKLRGYIHLAMATEMSSSGKTNGAMSELRLAEEVFADASQAVRSDPEIYEGLCMARYRVLLLEMDLGVPPQRTFSDVMDACGMCLEANPDDVVAYRTESAAYLRLAMDAYFHGRDPIEGWERSAKLSARSLAIQPNDALSYQGIGNVYLMRGQYEADHGLDPRPSYEKAIRNYEKTVQLRPGQDSAYDSMGLVYWLYGQYELYRGGDPRDLLAQSMSALEKATQHSPTNFNAYNNLGFAYLIRAQWEMDTGKDPAESFKIALPFFRKALQIRSDFSYAYINLGSASTLNAAHLMSHGQSPVAALDEAIQDFLAAVGLNPDSAYTYSDLSMACVQRAKYELSQGRDPAAWLAQAAQYSEQATRLNPEYPDFYVNKGDAILVECRFEGLSGRSPSACAAAATAAFRRALAIKADSVEACRGLVETQLERALWAARSHVSPLKLMAEGGAYLRTGLGINARSSVLHRLKAEYDLLEAQWKQVGTIAPLDAAERAIALNPDDPENYRVLAEIHLWRARTRGSTDAISAGLSAVDRGLSVNSRMAELFLLKSRLYSLKALEPSDAMSRSQAVQLSTAARKRASELNPILAK